MSLPIAWSEIYAHPLPKGHRFPMEKYDLIPRQLLYEGTIEASQLFTAEPLGDDQILRVHDAAYWDKLKHLQLSAKEQRESGFPLSSRLVERESIICNGTVVGALKALEGSQCAFNVAGGTHHAYSNKAEGFCLLNDIAIAASELLYHNKVKNVLVIDLDVHQGNGTAKIFEDDNRVYTFSMHGDRNYPFRKEKSDLDVALPNGINDHDYLHLLKSKLDYLKKYVRADFVFYQAGVDILESDKLGKLGVSLNGCAERDALVLEFCKQQALPLQITMGGGYSPKIKDIIEAHANTYRLAMKYFT